MKKANISFTMELSDKQALEALAKRDKTTLSSLVSELVISGLKQKINDTEMNKIQTDINKRLDEMNRRLDAMTETDKWMMAWGITQKKRLEKMNEGIADEFEKNYRNL